MAEEGKTTFNELKAYEARRRLASSSKIDSSSLYWKSYLDLMKGALWETGRAQRLVSGTCRAHQVYADAMEAMHSDRFLDEKGHIASDKQQKRLQLGRKASVVASASNKKSVLSDMRAAHKTMTSQFRENAENMNEEIADAITSLLVDVRQQFSALEEIGSAVLIELEKTESEVIAAWSRYLSKTDTTTVKSQFSTSPKSPQETAADVNMMDRWVVETQYRVAVAYQNALWDQASSKLDELFREVKQQEILRRMNLREFLVAFIQRQQRLFMSLPSIHNAVLEELVEKELSREDIERELKVLLKDKVEADQAKAGIANLDSPLKSDLLANAQVVERRAMTSTSGVSRIGSTADWKTSLAVMTSDCYLHFFDLDDGFYTPGMSPELVLQGLMPNVIVPTANNLTSGKSNFSRGWSDSLTPSDSMVLAKCKLHDVDESSFTIVEKGGGSNTASIVFGKFVDKKLQVRLTDKVQKDEFINALMN